MEKTKKIATLALFLGGLVIFTAFAALVLADREGDETSVAGEWNGFSLDTRQVLVGNDTSKFPFSTNPFKPGDGDDFAFVQFDAKNEKKKTNTNLNPYFFELELADGQTKQVSTAQFVEANHWPGAVEASQTVTLWLVYECPKNATISKLQCVQPTSATSPVVMLSLPPQNNIVVTNNINVVVNNSNDDNAADQTPSGESHQEDQAKDQGGNQQNGGDGGNNGGGSNGGGGVTVITPQCPQPWPVKMEMIGKPTSMEVGKTYTVKCQMMVQNYDTQCKLSPWYYAPNTVLYWTFKDETNGYQDWSTSSSTTDDSGIATISFLCKYPGTWTATCQWYGSERYMSQNAHTSVDAKQSMPPTYFVGNLKASVDKVETISQSDWQKYPFVTYTNNSAEQVFVLMTFMNTGSQTAWVDTYSLQLKYNDGYAVSASDTRSADGSYTYSPQVLAGSSTQVWLMYNVPAGATLDSLSYQTYINLPLLAPTPV